MRFSEKTFRFPVKKLVTNIFWDTQEMSPGAGRPAPPSDASAPPGYAYDGTG